MSHGSAHQERRGLLQDLMCLGERGLAWMQDWKDDTSLGTRSSARHEALDCCPSRRQALDRPHTPANPKARQGRELMPACRMGATLVVV